MKKSPTSKPRFVPVSQLARVTGGLITEIGMPALDARDYEKEPANLGVTHEDTWNQNR